MSRWLGRLALVLLAACGFTPACGTGVEEDIALAATGEHCQLNSDCAADLACVFELCHTQCVSSRDCKHGFRCVRGQEGHHVCQLPTEVSCQGVQDCPGDQICSVDAECRDSCEAGCLADQSCSAGACADAAELDEQGELPRASHANGDAAPCELASDCLGDQVCRRGGCRDQCDATAPCEAGSSCQEGVCQADSVKGPCLRNSDCLASQRCEAGMCLQEPKRPEPACHYDSDCDVVGQHCSGGECVCECLLETDCPAGWTCMDSCACTRGVVHNQVSISNADQLRELADVVTIDGKLEIAPGAALQISLPHLKSVGSLSVAGKGTVFSAESLTTVAGALECEGDCRLPKLASAGDVTLKPGNQIALDFPALESAGNLTLSDSQASSLSLPVLTKLTDLTVQRNAQLTSVSLPVWDKDVTPPRARWITISDNAELRELDVGATQPATVDINQNPKLESVSFPAMTKVVTTLTIKGASRLTSLNLPLLASVGTLSYSESAGPSTWELRSLTNATSFSLFAVEGMREIWAPVFTYATMFQVQKTSLVAIDLPLGKPPTPPNPLGPPAINWIDINDNQKLQRVSFNELQIVDSVFSLAANRQLTQLDLPVLSKGGSFSLSYSLLTNLDTLKRQPAQTPVAMTGFGAESNTQLATCPLQALLQTMTITFPPTLSNNLCPCVCP